MAGGGGGVDDNTAQGGHLVAYQQQSSNVRPAGTLRSGNGAVTGGVPFLAATITARQGKGPDSDATTTLVTHALTAEGSDASEDGTGRGTPIIPVDLAQVTSGQNRSNPKDGGPDGTLAATSRSAVAFGHTVGIDVQASENVTPTLRVGSGGASVAAASVRRLTPVECERLQGYPDEWTLKRAELVQAGNRWEQTGTVLEQADAPRYRQLGNSIAVPVFAWVASGIVMVEEGVADIGTPYDPVS